MTNPISLVVHDDLLECNQGARFPRPRAVNLTEQDSSVNNRNGCSGKTHDEHIPKGTLAQFTQDFIVGNPRAAHEAAPVPLVRKRKSARRHDRASAALLCLVDAHRVARLFLCV